MQDPGLSPDTVFFNLFFKNLAADLKKDKALLASIANASLVVGGPNQGESVHLRLPLEMSQTGTDEDTQGEFVYVRCKETERGAHYMRAIMHASTI